MKIRIFNRDLNLLIPVFSFLLILLFLSFHHQIPSRIKDHLDSRFNLVHFSLELISTEKEFYHLLGFPQTEEYELRKNLFIKAYRSKLVYILLHSLFFYLFIRALFANKSIRFVNYYFLLILLFLYIASYLYKIKSIFYILQDRVIGSNDYAIYELNLSNDTLIFSSSLFFIYISILFWIKNLGIFYKLISILLLTSKLLLLFGLKRLELQEFSYFFESFSLLCLYIFLIFKIYSPNIFESK
jgi:hypothetical protein